MTFLLLGFLGGIAFCVTIAGFGLAWWLGREKQAEPLSRVEREFLQIVGRARR